MQSVQSAFPCVDPRTYTSGKDSKEQAHARRFLEAAGVREVGEREQIEAILKERYARDMEEPDDKTYKRDLKRFMSFVADHPGEARLFRDEFYWVFKGEDGEWKLPISIYIDKPFSDTGLADFYEGDEGSYDRVALANKFYSNIGISIKKLVDFAVAVGCLLRLEIRPMPCGRSNPEWHRLDKDSGVRCTLKEPIFRDYEIDGLEPYLRRESIETSRLVWKTMRHSTCNEECLEAIVYKNEKHGRVRAKSLLVHHLRGAAWVPQKDGLDVSFVVPAEASEKLLPNDFEFNAEWQWIKAIKFGQQVKERSEEKQQTIALAKQLGFGIDSSEGLERAKIFSGFPIEKQQEILNEFERKSKVGVPDDEPSNPERRREKVLAAAYDAPGRDTEMRLRSVSKERDAVKSVTYEYLRARYTEFGLMSCQLCNDTLPFKKRGGKYYFMAVEFLEDLKNRHHQNYLALCPNHAAMFRYEMYHKDSRDNLRSQFLAAVDNKIELSLVGRNLTLHFAPRHKLDIKGAIESENLGTGEDND